MKGLCPSGLDVRQNPIDPRVVATALDASLALPLVMAARMLVAHPHEHMEGACDDEAAEQHADGSGGAVLGLWRSAVCSEGVCVRVEEVEIAPPCDGEHQAGPAEEKRAADGGQAHRSSPRGRSHAHRRRQYPLLCSEQTRGDDAGLQHKRARRPKGHVEAELDAAAHGVSRWPDGGAVEPVHGRRMHRLEDGRRGHVDADAHPVATQNRAQAHRRPEQRRAVGAVALVLPPAKGAPDGVVVQPAARALRYERRDLQPQPAGGEKDGRRAHPGADRRARAQQGAILEGQPKEQERRPGGTPQPERNAHQLARLRGEEASSAVVVEEDAGGCTEERGDEKLESQEDLRAPGQRC